MGRGSPANNDPAVIAASASVPIMRMRNPPRLAANSISEDNPPSSVFASANNSAVGGDFAVSCPEDAGRGPDNPQSYSGIPVFARLRGLQ